MSETIMDVLDELLRRWEVTTVPETVKDVFEELLARWHEERELAILTSPADKGVKALRLDLLEGDYEAYHKRFEAALPNRQPGAGAGAFKVRCIQFVGRLFVATSGDVILYRDLQLPFAPYPGLTLEDGDWECNVTRVCYDVSEGVFKCYTAPDRPALGEQRSPKEMAEIVSGYVSAGWQKR